MVLFKRYDNQIREIFLWLGKIVDQDDMVALNIDGRMSYHAFSFPMHYGDMPKKIGANGHEKCTFTITKSTSGHVERLLGEISDGDWITIFSSPYIRVKENRGRKKTTIPLRYGLDASERQKLLEVARAAIQSHVSLGSQRVAFEAGSVSARFNLKADVDVALYANGHLRGSTIMESVGLGEGVAHAAVRSCADSRFKPIGTHELDDLWIEITILRDLRITLSPAELRAERIYCEKGYGLIAGAHKGFFLPEVHNITRFSNLTDLRARLASEKAGVTASARASVATFEVEDFIASPGSMKLLPLFGPVVDKTSLSGFDDIAATGHGAAEWLMRIQERDGNLPPIVSTTRDLPPRVDAARLAFTMWALAEFGKVTETRTYIEAAQQALAFLEKRLPKQGGANDTLSWAYGGQLARAAGDEDIVPTAEKKLLQTSYASADTITLAQAASFLAPSSDAAQRRAELHRELRSRFETGAGNREVMDLAVFAELVNVFHTSDPAFSKRVTEWLIKHQYSDGSFPQSARSSFSYARGTGKIFEVLALEPEANEAALLSAARWLSTMQYDDQNLFFVVQSRRDLLRGAFRHDYQNTDAWIDAAGHVLLGLSRIMSR